MNTRKNVEKLNGKLNIVGEKITELRKKSNLSRQDISNQLMILGIDISSQSIYDIEIGSRTVVDYELCAIAKILNISSDSLLKDFKEYIDKI